MDRLKKARKPMRAAITRTGNEVAAELVKETVNLIELRVRFDRLQKIQQEVAELDQQILDRMLDENSEEEYETERKSIEQYQDDISRIKIKMNNALNPILPPTNNSADWYDGVASSSSSSASGKKKRNFKLPKIEIKKFNGEVTEWLSFWSQFEKIHEDDDIHDTDKFQYLVQAMIKGTRAMKLVESYPQSSENYPKVIAALQDRYGDKVILGEVYVRKLLKMVCANVGKTRENVQLSNLYDELETNLRSLESLGVKSEHSALFLYPLIESSLPEEIVKVWQRSAHSGYGDDQIKDAKERLEGLMKFLRAEVKGAERLSYVKAGLSDPGQEKKVCAEKKNSSRCQESEVPTGAGLFSGQSSMPCIFCQKNNHSSSVCYRAEKMSLDEKKEAAKKNKLCLCCLKSGHFARNCPSQINCVECVKKHCKAMCPLRSVQKTNEQSSNSAQASASNSNVTCRGDVLLKTLVLKAVGPKATTRVRLIYDEGSQLSNGGATTIDRIGSKCVGEEWARNVLFGGSVTDMQKIKKYQVELESLDGKTRRKLVLRKTVKICGSIPRVPAGPWMEELYSRNIWLSDYHENPVDNPDVEILIGSDYWGQLVTGRQVRLKCGLIAVETVFGWTLSGPVSNVHCNDTLAMSCVTLFHGCASVADLWSLESIGIKDPGEHKSKKEKEESARQHFLSTVSRNEEGRYSVTLPWVDAAPILPDNRMVAEKRLITTTAKLKANGYYNFYDQIFKDWEKEEIIESVCAKSPTASHYLPHRAVIKEESLTTPVRPVFDASCKIGRSPSLNDCLEKGPNLLELIPSLMLRFREKKLGVISDVRKAFQMIEIDKVDRNFVRFLWWTEDNQIKVYQHRRVVFGVNCSPFLLGAVIEFHLDAVVEERKRFARILLKSLYVDNCVTSVDSIEDYEEFKFHSTAIMSEAKMDLRQWECTAVDMSEPNNRVSDGAANPPHCLTNVLGLKWDKVRDELFVDIPKMEIEGKLTKRVILSLVQQIFDPMGFLSPATLVPKLMLQRTWERKKTWDEDLDGDVKSEFGVWWKEAPVLARIKIPRWAFGSLSRKYIQLHVFCDASKAAYAAAVFVRVEDEAKISVQLLQSKARVAPLKKMTIPRLELLGCSIAARLYDSVKSALSIEGVKVYFWSDSMTALSWIRRNDDWGTFVGNRVQEVCTLTKVEDWRHVPGAMNPADLPSRGCTPSQLLKSRWWEGPAWLRGPAETWPSQEEDVDEDEVLKERKKGSTAAQLVSTEEEVPWYARKYSSYYKNVRLVAWWKRFVTFCAKGKVETGVLKRWELDCAEKLMFKRVQVEVFPQGGSNIGGFLVEIKDGLICMKTKLQNRQDSIGFRYPVLLPSSHPLVEQLIREEHILNQHAGVQFLMGRIREKCWILGGRRAIKKVVSSCVTCRRFKTKKPCVPPASLPEDRVKTALAFQVTGVDLAGPMILRNRSKCWMVLFTCAVYRCVHLELVSALSTEDFLMALWRFISRRGRPTKIYSDNGTNFVGADNLFRQLDWKRIEHETQVHRIQWQFNPPSAAWWGGWWERLIGIIKDLLKRVLKNRKLSLDQLHTTLCQIEGVINDRPLTYVTEDQDDLIPLTPSMFLREIQEVDCPEVEALDAFQIRANRKAKTSLREEFRVRFRNEYLSQLVQRGKGEKVHQFIVGDVVLIGDDNKKRLMWEMGRIAELMVGKDGKCRVAKVKTAHGHLVRPLQRLFPLEISHPVEVQILNPQEKESTGSEKVDEIEKLEQVCAESVVKTSRFGRPLNKPSRFMNAK